VHLLYTIIFLLLRNPFSLKYNKINEPFVFCQEYFFKNKRLQRTFFFLGDANERTQILAIPVHVFQEQKRPLKAHLPA